eukprot:4540245-Amphidinium_carterae.1
MGETGRCERLLAQLRIATRTSMPNSSTAQRQEVYPQGLPLDRTTRHVQELSKNVPALMPPRI